MWRMLVVARLVIQLSLGQVAKGYGITETSALDILNIPHPESKGEDPVWKIRHLLPEVEIDPRLIHNVTVQVGTSAQLPCSFRKDYLEEVKRQHIEKQRQLRKQQQQQLQQQQQRYHDGLVDLHDIVFETPEIHEEETFDAEHQVSWFRRRDWHILTTGIFTYTTDERFEVIHPPDSGDWTLQIRYATARDSGMYECQKDNLVDLLSLGT
ncbi:uncharacterized protein LOC143018660 [Oratosquilla oratoria]|uniref:uncharacterized protein LOC143018660 n=1 Tax=Oratosquilla oratoria TaxID=337810 RepID=UPI003F764E9F